MKPFIIYLILLAVILFPCCSKEATNKPVYSVNATFSDIVTGAPIKKVSVDLVSCAGTDIFGQCNKYNYAGLELTDDKGEISYTGEKRADGFICAAPGYFPLNYTGNSKIDIEGSTYHVKLIPESVLQIELSPKNNYPAGYRLFFKWYCSYPAGNVIGSDGLFGGTNIDAAEKITYRTVAGDIDNTIVWTLSDENLIYVASDTLKNIVAPRSDTTHLELIF
jgi:hypothetical protein